MQFSGDAELSSFNPDVVIVGAGTVGCTLAYKLILEKKKVLLLDAGHNVGDFPIYSWQSVQQTGIPYKGIESGRFFGFGGTSALWGGQMLPLTEHDISARLNGIFPCWPIPYGDLRERYLQVLDWLGLETDFDSKVNLSCLESKTSKSFWLPRQSSWITHKKRNIWRALGQEISKSKDCLLLAGARVSDLQVNSGLNKMITGLRVDFAGKSLHISANIVVICCGAIESTRLISQLRDTQNYLNKTAPVGKFFSDHLSIRYAEICYKGWIGRMYLNSQFMNVFKNGVMKTIRFEMTPKAQNSLAISNTYAHVVMVTRPNSGFEVARKILRKFQGFKEPLSLKLSDLLGVTTDFFGLLIWRFFFKRLYIPSGSRLYLQVDVEQLPREDSRLFVDDNGQFSLHWKVGSEDIRSAKVVGEAFIELIENSDMKDRLSIKRCFSDESELEGNFYDVYHPTGTLRMGSEPENSVVDPNLKVWGIEGLYVNSTAVFPSAGAANPGLTHFALTFRLVDHLVNSVLKKDK